ncbi:MAG: lipoyl(octanoyl) transferase LipB [Acidiferrobacter sp.]
MNALIVRSLGPASYRPVWGAMRDFTDRRDATTTDELWLTEHPPVYTRGRNAREPAPAGAIPTVDTDRGGDLTYHGPGQIVAYTLFDLGRLGIGVRALVYGLEAAVITTLAEFGMAATRRERAPGVYIGTAKIAALGLRIRGGRSYHGVALNVRMDLAPFARIAPCGYPGLRVTQMADHGAADDPAVVAPVLTEALITHFGFIPRGQSHGPEHGRREQPSVPGA